MRIALIYNLKRVVAKRGGLDDEEAEYDGAATIAALATAIASFGHDVVELEATHELPRLLLDTQPDAAFNVAEGMRGRSREAHVPALLELFGIPYTGSDPASLVLTLDKGVAKAVVRDAGVYTPRGFVVRVGTEPLPADLTFPAIVKPAAEGSSKGVLPGCVARTEREARDLARAVVARYGQGALVEEYLPGREFTVGLLGDPPVVLAPMEIVLPRDAEFPVYSFDQKLEPTPEVRYEAPARVTAELERELRALARRAFHALGCRDVARVDVRLDARGRPAFVECNPLPGLTPGWSDLCLIAEASGIDYRTLVGRILEPALRRVRGAPRHRQAAVAAPPP